MTSVDATIKQGGAEGSAVNKVMDRTSTIGKNRRPPSQGITGGLDATTPHESLGDPDKIQMGEQDGDSSGEEDEEFDVVNPLFEHAGGESQRYPAEADLLLAPEVAPWHVRLFRGLRETTKVPDGRLSVSVLHVNGLKNAGDARIRFSLNGQVDWSDHTKKMFDLPHYKAPSLGVGESLSASSELIVEINDSETDSFWGSSSLPNVDQAVSYSAKKYVLPIVDSAQAAKIGELEVTLAYHKYNLSEMAGIRWKWLLETPKALGLSIQTWAWRFAESVKRVVIAGLPGMRGGAASWVVFSLLCVPFILASVLTKWSWATRQWLLVIPIYSYLFLSLPVILGWLFGTLVTVLGMHNYPGRFRCGALHVLPFVQGYALHLRVTATDLGMGNPPGFPLEHFWFCKRADVAGSISFKHVLDFMFLRYKKCPLSKVPDFRLLAKWNVDYIEVDEFTLDFMLHKGRFNVWEVSHLLADHEAKYIARAKGIMKADEPMPNELEIRIIRAKNLVKTRTSKRSMRAQQAMNKAASGPLGRNAVFDAFLEDESGAEDDEDYENDDEDDETEGDKASSKPSRSESELLPQGGARASLASSKAELEEEERRALAQTDQQRRKYRGLGPPQFNPMDSTVKRKSKQGHFDPYVVIQLRRDAQKTKTQTKTSSPMWNETFYFHVTDAATVIHVQVFNREVTQDKLIGQWVMTAKHLLANPKYCWHEKGLEITPDRWIRGWFPLMNKDFRGVGRCGKLEMAIQWRYVPEAKLRRKLEFPPLSALAQLQENSEESRLRMGDMARIKYWLNHEPFLFDVQRMSVFNFKMYLQDIFLPGTEGEADTKGVDQLHFIHIPRVDWLREFRPKHGDPGITLYKLLYVFFAGIAPKVLNTAQSQANISRTLGVIAGAAVPQFKHSLGQGVKSLMHGGIMGKGLMSLGKSTDRALQLVHRNVTVNKDAEAQFKVPVDADDEDFLLEQITLNGHLARYATKVSPASAPQNDEAVDPSTITDVDMEKESRRRGSFRRKYFELKGKTLFFRKNRVVPKGSIYGVTYKIPLSDVIGAIFFIEQEEIMLNIPKLGIVTRLRLVPTETEEGDDTDAVTINTLDKWFQAFKDCGVPCYTWKRSMDAKKLTG